MQLFHEPFLRNINILLLFLASNNQPQRIFYEKLVLLTIGMLGALGTSNAAHVDTPRPTSPNRYLMLDGQDESQRPLMLGDAKQESPKHFQGSRNLKATVVESEEDTEIAALRNRIDALEAKKKISYPQVQSGKILGFLSEFFAKMSLGLSSCAGKIIAQIKKDLYNAGVINPNQDIEIFDKGRMLHNDAILGVQNKDAIVFEIPSTGSKQ